MIFTKLDCYDQNPPRAGFCISGLEIRLGVVHGNQEKTASGYASAPRSISLSYRKTTFAGSLVGHRRRWRRRWRRNRLVLI